MQLMHGESMLLLKLVQPLVTVVEVVWQFQLLADLFCLRQEECASDEASFGFNLAAPCIQSRLQSVYIAVTLTTSILDVRWFLAIGELAPLLPMLQDHTDGR